MLAVMGSTTRPRQRIRTSEPKEVTGKRRTLLSADGPPKLAAVLRGARSHHALTLRVVEEKTGIPNGYLSQIEKGHIKRPDPAALWKLADLYRLDFFQMLNLAGHGQEPAEELAATARLVFNLLQELRPEDRQQALRRIEELTEKRGVREAQ